MPTRSLNVQITGDSRDFEKAVKRSSGAMDKFGKETSLHARLTSKGISGIGLAARGMTAGIGAAAVGVGFLTKQFVDSQKVSKQTDAVLKSTGGAAGVTAKQVSDLAAAISRKTGIDDEAIQSGENLLLTFTNVRNETGRGNAVFTRATRTIADMSAALGQDTKSSAIQLGKALNDPIKGVTALQRVGVSFTASQKEQIKTLVDSGKTLDAQKLILRELNKEFGGSAAAQATPLDKLKVSAGNLAETLGGHLAPILMRAATFLNRFFNQLQDGTGLGGRVVGFVKSVAGAIHEFTSALRDGGENADDWRTKVRVAFLAVSGFVRSVVGAIRQLPAAVRQFFNRNREDIQGVMAALRSLGRFFSSIFGDVIVPAVRAAIGPIREILGGVVQSLRGLIRIITGIVTGDWRRVWKGIKDVVVGAFNQLKGTFDLIARSLGPALVKLAGKLIGALIRGLGGLAGAIKDAIIHGVRSGVSAATGAVGDVISSLNPFGDGIGRLAKSIGDGVGGTLSAPGGAVNLMGADPDLLPFAAIGARMGLHVSSGLRPGAITSSGNVSFHSSGDAIDESGPPSAMLRFFQTMKGTFGSKLRELIYTPGGVGIKDGRPFRYTGQVAADHYDHVHVAYTGPFGDGIGRRSGTGDGHGYRTGQNGPPSTAAKHYPAFYRWARYARLPRHPGSGMWYDALENYFNVRSAQDIPLSDDGRSWRRKWTRGRSHDGIGWTARSIGDGPGDAAAAAYRYGGIHGRRNLINLVAISGRESRWRAAAENHNASTGDWSEGPWQINQLAHHGRFGTDAQLKTWKRNARAMGILFREGGLRPWHGMVGTGAFIGRATAAVDRFLSGRGSGGGGHDGGGGGGGAALGPGGTAQHVSGNTSAGSGSTTASDAPSKERAAKGYEGLLAQAGVSEAKARAKDNLTGLIRALRSERSIKRKRLARINKLLRRPLRRETRTRLLQEKSQLIGEIGDLSATIKEYVADRGGGATTVTGAEKLDAGVDPNADTGGGGGGDVGGGAGDSGVADAIRQLAAEMTRTREANDLLIRTQGPAIVNAVVAAVNGSIGGKVGLGFSGIRSPAGSTAGL